MEQPYLNAEIAKQFPDASRKLKWYTGRVVEKVMIRRGSSKVPAWHVVYKDGDREDLEVRASACTPYLIFWCCWAVYYHTTDRLDDAIICLSQQKHELLKALEDFKKRSGARHACASAPAAVPAKMPETPEGSRPGRSAASAEKTSTQTEPTPSPAVQPHVPPTEASKPRGTKKKQATAPAEAPQARADAAGPAAFAPQSPIQSQFEIDRCVASCPKAWCITSVIVTPPLAGQDSTVAPAAQGPETGAQQRADRSAGRHSGCPGASGLRACACSGETCAPPQPPLAHAHPRSPLRPRASSSEPAHPSPPSPHQAQPRKPREAPPQPREASRRSGRIERLAPVQYSDAALDAELRAARTTERRAGGGGGGKGKGKGKRKREPKAVVEQTEEMCVRFTLLACGRRVVRSLFASFPHGRTPRARPAQVHERGRGEPRFVQGGVAAAVGARRVAPRDGGGEAGGEQDARVLGRVRQAADPRRGRVRGGGGDVPPVPAEGEATP